MIPNSIRQYSLSNKVYMLICFLRTRIFYPSAKIIRFPFDIRNARFIRIGKNFSAGRFCRIEVIVQGPEEKTIKLFLGDNVRIGDFVHISALEKVEIGNNVGIGPKSLISDVNHGDFTEGHVYDIDCPYAKRSLFSKPVKIGDNVWIGELVSIVPGVTIGEGCVIGAMSNVVKSIPPYSMAVGNPAKVIKRYNFQTKCWEKVKNIP